MIYLVRHGETLWNKEKKLQGNLNSPLTEKGIEEAHKLAERLKDKSFSKIFSSPLKRAIETSEILNKYHSLTITELQDIREMGYGEWQGVPMEEVKKAFPEAFENYYNKPEKYEPVAGGESFSELRIRLERALDELCEHAETNDILVVSHGVVIKMLLLIIKNGELKDLWQPPWVHNSSLSVINYDRTIITESDISHLEV